jgi:hypothetical protein
MPNWGIYEFARQKAEELAAIERGEKPEPVKNPLMEIYRKTREALERQRHDT